MIATEEGADRQRSCSNQLLPQHNLSHADDYIQYFNCDFCKHQHMKKTIGGSEFLKNASKMVKRFTFLSPRWFSCRRVRSATGSADQLSGIRWTSVPWTTVRWGWLRRFFGGLKVENDHDWNEEQTS